MNRIRLGILAVASVVAMILANPVQAYGQTPPSTQPASGHGSASQPEPLKPLKLDLGSRVTMDLVLVPAGKFMMGTVNMVYLSGDEGEIPHEVTITKPYFIGIYKVTQEQWKAVMGTQPWKGQEAVVEGKTYPATYVSWTDAAAFCTKLSGKTGKTVRLPTEAEWEYACRAGTTTRFCYGDEDEGLADYAPFATSQPETQHPYPVGQKKPNAWGLYDMHGNVMEYCSDWFRSEYGIEFDPKDFASCPPALVRAKKAKLAATMKFVDPQGPPASFFEQDQSGKKTFFRVMRGGLFGPLGPMVGPGHLANFRSASRVYFPPDMGAATIGFRVVVVAR